MRNQELGTNQIYRPQQSCGNVLFLHLSVILFTAGCLPQCMLGYTPWADTSCVDTPKGNTPRKTLPGHTPPGRHHPPGQIPSADNHPWRSRRRMLCILLECILVSELKFYPHVLPSVTLGAAWLLDV